jgi:hypothetical protein
VGQSEYFGGCWSKAAIFLNSFAHVSWTPQIIFAVSGGTSLKLSTRQGTIFNLEVYDLIGL